MKQSIIASILATKLLVMSLYADPEYSNQSPSVSVAFIQEGTIRFYESKQFRGFENTDQLLEAVSQMLYQSGYDHDPSKIKILETSKNYVSIIDTSKGKKFVKVKKRGAGFDEYLGALIFKNFAPILPIEELIISNGLELLVHPFNASAEPDLLFYRVSTLEAQDSEKTLNLLNSIFADSLKLSTSTMYYSVRNAKNDEFYFNRLKTLEQDGVSGRIEKIYQRKKFKIMDQEIPWEELKTLHWTIDGISYQETIENLLEKAKVNLSPNQSRLIGISHGNWHENNVIVDDSLNAYTYFAMEFAGENDLIADAIMFLLHTTVYADYLNPVYYPLFYGGSTLEEESLKNTLRMKQREITFTKNEKTINVAGVFGFGTLQSRKKIAELFNEKYLKPLTLEAVKYFGSEISSDVNDRIKSTILLRLIAGQDVSKMTPQDQMKMIGLIYKSIGTPIEWSENTEAFDRFMNAL